MYWCMKSVKLACARAVAVTIVRAMEGATHNGHDDQDRRRKCHNYREDSDDGFRGKRHCEMAFIEVDFCCK